MLSFDVEEYFQVASAAAAGIGPDDWDSYPPRAAGAVDRLLGLLEDHHSRATFFVLGWVARREPELIRRIARAGHEIASHGMTHAMLGCLDPARFGQELRDSRAILEDLAGQAVTGYRAPTFSITHATAWALDVLAEAGYTYDSSVFPVRHDRYGVPDAPVGPHRAIGPGGAGVVEVPPLTLRWLGANLPVGGGGYLRLLPVALVARAIHAARRRGRGAMIYMHPWEIDPDQPVLPMGRLGRWRHRVGLGRAEGKLRRLLREFRFTTAGEAIASLATGPLPEFRYGRNT